MFEQLGLIGCGLMGGSFALALKRFGFEGRRHPPFDCTRFVPPLAASPQGELF